MENTPASQPQNVNTTIQQPLPNATAVLVLGILSIAVCWCYGLFGITMGIIALVLSGKAKALYNKNPEQYTQASYKNMNAGRIPVKIKITDPRFAEYAGIIPGGAFAQTAVYSDHGVQVAFLRRILIRMSSWMNYLFPFR